MDTNRRGEDRFPVRRITVDGRIHNELMRLVVAGLNDQRTEQVPLHSLDVWTREEELHVSPKDYLSALGIGEDESSLAAALRQVREREEVGSARDPLRVRLWRELREGQVFLSGAFVLVPPEAPAFVRPAPGRQDFRRIDRLDAVKREFKRLYANALSGTKHPTRDRREA